MQRSIALPIGMVLEGGKGGQLNARGGVRGANRLGERRVGEN